MATQNIKLMYITNKQNTDALCLKEKKKFLFRYLKTSQKFLKIQ